METLRTEQLATEQELLAAAVALGARDVPKWTAQEDALVASLPPVAPSLVQALRAAIQEGQDPLGECLCALRSPAVRRPMGAIYTPQPIVEFMTEWAKKQGQPGRVIDPGAGSGRFLLCAAKRFPQASLLGVELDPVASILLRANLAAAELANRAVVMQEDYRSMVPPPVKGTTLYLSNPPYVRHHLISGEWKRWLAEKAAAKGYRYSQLAGLHAYFFLATALRAAPGDYGIFITAAEWLDVNYGRLIRDLFLDRLGGLGVLVVEPTAEPFPDTATTAAITTFRIGARPDKIQLRRVAKLSELGDPDQGRVLRRERLEVEQRWSHLSRGGGGMPTDCVELGELFRVHRGQVTGANKIWIEGRHSKNLPPSVLYASVTKARELLKAGLALKDPSVLRRVIDIPSNLDLLEGEDRERVMRFLKLAKAAGADQGYVARNRKAWWSVGLKSPAPILATYMARRPPAFVRNLAEARHINIAHGLYPREVFSDDVLEGAVKYLSGNASVFSGRTYAGGLTKFEPREMERLPIPLPSTLASLAAE